MTTRLVGDGAEDDGATLALAVMFKLTLKLLLAFALKRESQHVAVGCAGADAGDRTLAGV